MSDPGRRHGLSAMAPRSTSSIDRPSSVPAMLGSIVGCEGGAAAGGSVDGSGPSSAFGSCVEVGEAAEEIEGCAATCGVEVVTGEVAVVEGGTTALIGAPRWRVVYSVVRDDGCWGADCIYVLAK